MAGPRSFRYDIFLSHSSADKPAVRELAERLRAAGLRVWLDEWIIRPGDHISTAIDEGLEHSAVLLLCMSAQAFGSEWVSLEGYSAIFRDPLNRDRRFLPLRLDDAPIKAMLQGYAWIDWRPGADREAEWARLLAACRPEDLDRPDRADPAAGPGAEVETCADSTAELATPAAQDRQEGHRMAQLRALNLLHPGPVLSVTWSADGQRLASGGSDGTVRVWEAASGRELAVLEGHKGLVRSVSWSSDGQLLASGGEEGTVRLWDAASGCELAVLEGHKEPVMSVAWSADGQRLASGGSDGTVRLWDKASGRELAVLEGHKGPVRSVGWSADGKRLASCGSDGTVRLWKAASGQHLAVLNAHQGRVSSVGWSADGQRLVSGGDDGTVRLWMAVSGQHLAVLEGHQGRVSSVGWSA
ncbi:MAG: WD40 repeat domain-containing protein, partial [Cyanobium sp.]